MSVNFEYYKIFYYVAKYKNITQAASALLSSQPNVSRVIKLLEAELGCQLMVRSSRGIRLTEEGERLYQHVAAACEQLKAGEEQLRRNISMEGGVLSIAATDTALHLLMFDRLGEFHRRYPKVGLKIYNYTTKQAIRAVKNGQMECAVITSPLQEAYGLTSEKIMEFQDILLGGTEFWQLSTRPHDLRKLQKYSFISLERGTNTFAFYHHFFMEHGLLLEPDMEVANTDLMLPMIEHNLGIGFLTRELARKPMEEGMIFEIPLKRAVPPREVCFIYDDRRGLGKPADCLRKMLLQKRQHSTCEM